MKKVKKEQTRKKVMDVKSENRTFIIQKQKTSWLTFLKKVFFNTTKKVLYILKKLWSIYGVIAAVTGASIVSIILPKIELKPEVSLDISQPFRTLISIKNKSALFSFHNVHPYLMVYNLTLDNGETIANTSFDSYGTNAILPELKADESAPFLFDVINVFYKKLKKPVKIKYAQVAFIINYEYCFLKREVTFYYGTEMDANGNTIWYELPDLIVKQHLNLRR